jgi:GNAT superfamily N-acetyltransferase
MSKVEFVNFKTLTDSELNSVSQSIILLDPEFYKSISSSADEVIQIVSKIVLLSSSDCGAGEGMRVDGDLVGYISFFPTDELRMRSFAAMKVITDTLKIKDSVTVKDFLVHAQKFKKTVQPIDPYGVGFYLNKIAVFPEFRGYGTILFDRYLQKAAEYNLNPIFHCRFDNHVALHFYKKMNFVMSSCDYKYRLMTEASNC